jgi:hypothetical protein
MRMKRLAMAFREEEDVVLVVGELRKSPSRRHI